MIPPSWGQLAMNLGDPAPPGPPSGLQGGAPSQGTVRPLYTWGSGALLPTSLGPRREGWSQAESHSRARKGGNMFIWGSEAAGVWGGGRGWAAVGSGAGTDSWVSSLDLGTGEALSPQRPPSKWVKYKDMCRDTRDWGSVLVLGAPDTLLTPTPPPNTLTHAQLGAWTTRLSTQHIFCTWGQGGPGIRSPSQHVPGTRFWLPNPQALFPGPRGKADLEVGGACRCGYRGPGLPVGTQGWEGGTSRVRSQRRRLWDPLGSGLSFLPEFWEPGWAVRVQTAAEPPAGWAGAPGPAQGCWPAARGPPRWCCTGSSGSRRYPWTPRRSWGSWSRRSGSRTCTGSSPSPPRSLRHRKRDCEWRRGGGGWGGSLAAQHPHSLRPADAETVTQ